MIVTDWIHAIAGFLILLGLTLGYDCGGNPLFLHKYFLFLPLFVGLNLFQFAFSVLSHGHHPEKAGCARDT
jgi:hypothetical protein